MARNTATGTNPRGNRNDQASEDDSQSSAIAKLLAKVDDTLQEGQAEEALKVISRARLDSPIATNAIGVCQLRLGDGKRAVELLRGLAMDGLVLRKEAPLVFKTNYATALLVCNNVAGCQSVLYDINDEQDPAVQQLRATIRRWEEGLTFWQKIRWFLGDQPARPVQFDFAPGRLT